MNKRKVILCIAILVFIFSFCWKLFFTYSFGFFWEDFDYYHLAADAPDTYYSPDTYTLFNTIKNFIIEFINPSRFIRIGFSNTFIDRPYQTLSNDLLSLLFQDNILFYRIFKAIVFAISACLIFTIISHISVLWALLGLLVYITSAEMWGTVIGSSNVALYAQVAVLICIMIFLKLLKEKEMKNKVLWIYYVLILFFSQYAVLSKNDGRYLSIIFFLTILLFYRNQLLRHLPMLTMLLMFEVPILGYFKKLFFKVLFHPINIASYHTARSLKESISLMIKNYRFPMIALGKLLLILLFIIFLIHLILYLFYKKRINSTDKNFSIRLLKGRIFLFMLWFICAFIMIARARNFVYDGEASLLMTDCAFFMVPFYIFLCHYIVLISNYFNESGIYRKIFTIFCATLILLESFLFKLPRLNHFRGGWGNYFCAWDNTKKYIDNLSDKALALCIIGMHYKPFVFTRSKNEVLITNPPVGNNPFCDLEFIEKKFKAGGYRDIFVIYCGELNFRGESQVVRLEGKTVINGDTNDLYDRLKRMIKKSSQPIVHVYHFRIN